MLPTVGIVEAPGACGVRSRFKLDLLLGFVGGIEQLVRPGQTVLLKPNLRRLVYDSHRQLFLFVAEAVQRLGGRVVIGDSPWLRNNPARRLWEQTGLDSIARERGWEFVSFERSILDRVGLGKRVYFLPRIVLEADHVINIAPVLRNHRTLLAGAMFNLLGVIPGFKKGQYPVEFSRSEHLDQLLVDIYSIVQPSLTLADVCRRDDARGLSDPDNCRFLASTDGIAVDSVAAALTGLRPRSIRAVHLAGEAGLGIGWLEGINTVGDRVQPWKVRDLDPFGPGTRFPLPKPLDHFVDRFVWRKPHVDPRTCTPCGKCAESCPSGAVLLEGGKVPEMDDGLCVSCWHCQRACPESAISIQENWLTGRLH